LAGFAQPTEIPNPHVSEETIVKRPNSSMQLTRGADYAVRVMIYLALPESGGRFSLPQLAAATDAPESFLSKVLQSLGQAGLITSRRGQSGGFSITPRGRAASMREVIEAIDGEICLNLCLAVGQSCHRKPTCPAHPVWAKAQLAMIDVLSNATVAAMAAHTSLPQPSQAEGNQPGERSQTKPAGR
jgi:Rrf2 family protein